jgi:hypothetical protein
LEMLSRSKKWALWHYGWFPYGVCFVLWCGGFELRCSCLLGRWCSTWATWKPLLCWLFLRQGSALCSSRPGPQSFYICISLCSWDDRHAPLWPTIGWDRVLRTICLG